MGEAVRYDGGHCLKHLESDARQHIQAWQAQGLLLPLCPEVCGGLPVPRPAAEIQGVYVKTEQGIDVTSAFEAGAQAALDVCLAHGIQLAMLKQGSPSCGNSLVNDGSFQGRKVAGQGITARLLSKHGIQVFNEQEWQGLAQALQYKQKANKTKE